MIREVDRFIAGKGRHRLENTVKRWGIDMVGPAHRAETDAIAAGALLFRMLERGAIKPCPLGKLLTHTEKKRAAQERDFQAWQSRQPKRESA